MAINIVLPQVPTSNSVLVAVVSLTDSGGLAQVTSIVQTGATWRRGIAGNSGDERAEIWWSADADGASTSVVINTAADENETAIIAEYSGLTTFQSNAVDQFAADSANSATASSGTTGITTNANELAVAGFAIRGGSTVSAPTNGYAIEQQTATGAGGTDVAAALVTLTLAALQTTDTDVTVDSGATDWGGVVATFFGNLLQIDSVSPGIIPTNGGYLLTLTGKFDQERQYEVYVGPLGDETDPIGYFPSGNGDSISPISATALEVYSPELFDSVGDVVNIHAREVGNPTQIATLTEKLSLVDPDLKSLAFQMRKNFPPNYGVGPRNLAVLPRVGHVKNLLTWSQDFSNVAWTKSKLSLTSGIDDPLGTLLAFTMVEDGTLDAHSLFQSGVTITTPDTFVFSVYARAINRNWLTLEMLGSGKGAWFDLTNGVLGSPATVTGNTLSAIRNVGNGWHRCTIMGRIAAGATTIPDISTGDSDGGLIYQGLSQDSVDVAFAHFDVWSVERAYLGTTTTPVT